MVHPRWKEPESSSLLGTGHFAGILAPYKLLQAPETRQLRAKPISSALRQTSQANVVIRSFISSVKGKKECNNIKHFSFLKLSPF